MRLLVERNGPSADVDRNRAASACRVLRGRERVRERIRADGQIGLVVTDLDAGRQVADEDAAARRTAQLIGDVALRADPVDRLPEGTHQGPEAVRRYRNRVR